MTAVPTYKKASEGGHWYDRQGRLIETVPGSKGDPVRPDIRHARKFDLAPGCTTIIRAAHREQLVQYRERQVLMAALTLSRLPGESDDGFVDRVLRDSKEHAKQAAEQGSDVHGRIERRVAGDPWVLAADLELQRLTGVPLSKWLSEVPCVSEFGFATKSDLHYCDAQDATAWVVDVKTKDGTLGDLRLWDEHYQQLAATRQALGLPRARCAIVFVSRTEPQAIAIEADEPDLRDGWECFRCLLGYWQAKNRYRPSWADAVVA